MDATNTVKHDTLVLADTKVVSDLTQQKLFDYEDINACQFYYNKIPLSAELEADTPRHPRECCTIFVKDESEKNDKTK